ncbi:MAG TPA: hypothetical protein VHZ95_17165, partial [Polyangiales bacterium]|nr:hypothetical protein [Polyangiales bacterium]
MSDRLPEPQQQRLQPLAAERASATPITSTLPLGHAVRTASVRARPRDLRELQDFMIDAICEADEPDIHAIIRNAPG